ncbi:MAG TPA: glutathione S-transferase family protein [Caulobacteraceae bacterium]|jgi:glutathione S-transferase|nr:glutathione S-transferase family protein [Caulobacteraceae bacterium]
MLTLFHAPMSRSSRFIWMLEEIGAPYEIRPVSIFRPMQGAGSPDPANPHPNKRVPALLDDGVLVTESQAIALYLADQFPEAGLAPRIDERDRGEYLTWMAWYSGSLEHAMFAAFEDALDDAQKKRNHEEVVARLEAALADGPWVMGEQFTAADILIGSAINWARKVFPESDALDAYGARCAARPAAVRAMALDEASGEQKAA